MMRSLSLVLLVALVVVVAPVSPAVAGNIAAVVNDDVVTSTDLESRLRMVIVSSGFRDTPLIRKKLYPQVLGALVDEQLMFQEADRLGIEIDPEEIAQGFSVLAAQNNVDVEQFKTLIERSGVDLLTMERQIEAQIAWTKVVKKEINPRVFISDGDIDNYLSRLKAAEGKVEYLLSEIFLPVDGATKDAETLELAKRVVKDVRAGAPFAKIAAQLSKAAGAQKNGGSLGWMQRDQMSKEIAYISSGLKKGEVSAPTRSSAGYHIVLMQDKRLVSAETLPSRDEVRAVLAQQRIDRMQRRHLMDLKSVSFIEARS